ADPVPGIRQSRPERREREPYASREGGRRARDSASAMALPALGRRSLSLLPVCAAGGTGGPPPKAIPFPVHRLALRISGWNRGGPAVDRLPAALLHHPPRERNDARRIPVPQPGSALGHPARGHDHYGVRAVTRVRDLLRNSAFERQNHSQRRRYES